MKVTGKYVGAQVSLDGTLTATFSINEKSEAIPQLDQMSKDDVLSIEVKKYRQKRTRDANGLLWACLGEMASVLRCDKWEVYLRMLKRYGQFTYIEVKPNAVARMKEVWREIEEVGASPNGNVQLLCYFGSSTYDTQEFSVLLDGVISEMKELGLQPPLPKETQEALDNWERHMNSR